MHALDPALQLAGILVLFFVFLSAAASKFTAIDVFRGVLHDYRVLPTGLVGIMAWALPVSESVGAVALLWSPTRTAGIVLLALITLAASAAIIVNLRRGRTHVDCGCFRSASRQPIGWRLVLRNAVLLIVAAACLVDGSGRSLAWIDIFSAFAAAIALTIMYVAVPYTDLRLPALRAELDAAEANNPQG